MDFIELGFGSFLYLIGLFRFSRSAEGSVLTAEDGNNLGTAPIGCNK
jgi:hypothetical protein